MTDLSTINTLLRHSIFISKPLLRPFPRSLATREGDLVKTSKAKLLHAIEDKVNDCTVSKLQVPDKACILDAMAIIQTVAPVPGTFGELAKHLLKKLLTSLNIVIANA